MSTRRYDEDGYLIVEPMSRVVDDDGYAIVVPKKMVAGRRVISIVEEDELVEVESIEPKVEVEIEIEPSPTLSKTKGGKRATTETPHIDRDHLGKAHTDLKPLFTITEAPPPARSPYPRERVQPPTPPPREVESTVKREPKIEVDVVKREVVKKRAPIEEPTIVLYGRVERFYTSSDCPECVTVDVPVSATLSTLKSAFATAVGRDVESIILHHISHANAKMFGMGDIRMEDGRVGRLLTGDSNPLSKFGIVAGNIFEISFTRESKVSKKASIDAAPKQDDTTECKTCTVRIDERSDDYEFCATCGEIFCGVCEKRSLFNDLSGRVCRECC